MLWYFLFESFRCNGWKVNFEKPQKVSQLTPIDGRTSKEDIGQNHHVVVLGYKSHMKIMFCLHVLFLPLKGH